MPLPHDSDSGPRLPDELVDAAISAFGGGWRPLDGGDPFLGELDDVAIRLRRAAQHSAQRKIYGLTDALNQAASSAESWSRALHDEDVLGIESGGLE